MQKWVVICSLGLLAAPSLSKVDARAETAHVLHVSIFGVPISLRQAESKKGCRKSRPAGLRHSLFVVKVCAPKYDRVIRYSFPSSDNMLNILQERLAQFDIYIPLYFCYAPNVHIPAVSSSICQGSSLMSSSTSRAAPHLSYRFRVLDGESFVVASKEGLQVVVADGSSRANSQVFHACAMVGGLTD